jgi:hypothetical protein
MKKRTKLIVTSFVLTLTFAGSIYFADKALADNQEPILIEISDTDIGTAAYEQLIGYGNGGHAAIGAILGNAQNMESNPGIGFSIGSGGNGYRPSIIIAVWTNQQFNASTGLDTIKNYFNVPVNPVTTNGDCAISCDGTTQVEKVITTTTVAPTTTIAVTPITTTTTVAPTTTLPEVVAPTQVFQSPQTTQPVPVQSQPQPVVYNTQPYTNPTTTTTTVVESVNVASAFVNPLSAEKLISPISKPKVTKHKVIKSNKAKKVLTKIK